MPIKVVFHIDEMPKWKLLLNNVANLMKSFDETDVKTIEVLANSEAVKAYAEDRFGDTLLAMDHLAKQGVRFVACNNALNRLQIAKEKLYPFVDIVPAGVRELVDRQMDGYAYIKP